MRVLHLTPGNLYGGIETLLATLGRSGRHFPQMETHFGVCFEGRFSREMRDCGIPVHILGGARARDLWSIWMARRRFREVLRRTSYDAVVSHGAWAHAILGPVVRSAGLPLVFWLHDPPVQKLSWLERWAQHVEADLMICNSQYTVNHSGRVFPGLERKVIYCAVAARQGRDSQFFDRDSVRSELDTPPGACVILQVSRLDIHKGHRMHLEALGKLKDVAGWVCWQVAEPQRPHEIQYLAELKEQAAALGIADRVRFLGWQADIGKLFGAADIFCQPNVGPEPFGITFVEALYDSLPVVTTALGGAVEIVDESCGIQVRANDISHLAQALRSLIENPELRRRLGRNGPARAEALCSPLKQQQRLYETLLSKFPRPAAVNAGREEMAAPSI